MTTTESTNLWMRRFTPAPDAPARLVCLPHAGGAASYFLPISRALAPRIDVLSVQYPGRQDRRLEPRIENMPELADLVTEQLVPLTDKPVTLFGHSLGATLAFEVTRRLEARGIEPRALVVSGRRAPSRHRNEGVHLRDDEGLIAEIRSLEGTAAAALSDPDILRMSLPAIRSDYVAAETYRYVAGDPVRTPISAHIGTSDPKAPVEDAAAWEQHTSGEFRLSTYSGGHFYLADHIPALITVLETVSGGTMA
ncbi:thioesterase II family protein [Nocardia stercoris]|uniref:Thioesterase TesA n=1 Tax=Nocardia stercoris TaxID=2483361 RepID=A0A3M2LFS3_9NOCA|nr:alpha/beta fold hydrolase [Nocardia stercoris]RMI34815.1 thioesterase [Nocardia stercoris]